jgi:hypothetical protein
MYLLHGLPGRPGAFLETVRMGVVEDELVALHRARPLILVMPFGSTGSFTDKEWVNGVGKNQGWATFVYRDVVRAVDAQFRTIPSPRWRVLAGLSEGGYGALNIGLAHPHEFGVIESWSGYALADPIRSTSVHLVPELRANSPLDTLAASAPALRRGHVFIWFPQRGATTSGARTPSSPRRSPPRTSRTASGCARRPHRGSLARQRMAGLLHRVPPPRERECVGRRPSRCRSPSCLRRPVGCTPAGDCSRCTLGSARPCPSTSSRGIRPYRS